VTDPRALGAVDTLIGFKDRSGAPRDLPTVKPALRGERHAAEYMYTEVPDGPDATADVVAETLAAMDRNGVAVGLVALTHPDAAAAARTHPGRFVLATHVDADDVLGAPRRIRADHAEHGIRAVTMFPAGGAAVAVDDPRAYPVYATCVELGLPVFVTAGVPGPRVPMAAQHVERFDRVCYDFPDLTLVMRHGAEPWADLAVKSMLKWPGLHWSSSAFSPRHYPAAIVAYANTRGADKVLYGGYFPFALELDRIFDELAAVPLRDHVWAPFLRDNARRVLGLDPA
jgi:uncharacterized protein